MFYLSQFKPAWWLRNPHAQTMLAKFIQTKKSSVQYLERINTSDNDFYDVAWTTSPDEQPEQPIVVVLHGLEGSQNSHYAKGMLNAIAANNWIGALIHFRGCSGQPNQQAASYHSGDIRDLVSFTERLTAKYPNRKLALIGFSLGGNVVSQYLAQHPNNPYCSAVIICAPLDLASCSKKINQGMAKIYQRYLVGMLKNSTLKKIALMPVLNMNEQMVNNINTMWQFDELITAPLNGFKSAEHYYQQVSGIKVLNKITTPCLILHDQDDPFLDHDKAIQIGNLPSNIRFEISQKAGHVGFISGNNPLKPIFWLEQRVPAYLTEYL